MAQVLTNPRLGIGDLEPEIVAEILEYVNDESPRTTSAIALVSKYFYSAVKLVRYHRTTMDWSTDESAWVVCRKKSVVKQGDKPPTFTMGQMTVDCKDPELLQRVRILTIGPVYGTNMTQSQSHADQELVDILSKASNIRVVNWIPRIVPSAATIEAIEKYHPKAQLRIHRIAAAQYANHLDPERLPKAEAALAKATCLKTLGIQSRGISRGAVQPIDYKKIIVKAPNLEFVSLISDYPERSEEDQVSFKRKASKIRHLTLDGWPLADETVDFWSKYVNLTSLESFKCSRGWLSASYFERASELLSGLKHITLNLNSQAVMEETTQAAEKYISTCSPLTTLSLWSWMGKVSLETILNQHGPTLKSLQLHEREEIGEPGGQRFMSLDDIKSIRASCPNLKSFTFDLKRKSKRPSVDDHREILEQLKAMDLETLEIYLDSGLLYLQARRNEELISDDEGTDDDDDDDDEDDSNTGDDNDGNADQGQEGDLQDSNEQNTTIAPAKVAVPNSCGGAFDSTGLEPIHPEGAAIHDYRIPNPNYSIHNGTTEIIFHPPTSADDICTFTGDVWKFLFGSRITGPRILDLKFGEWEKKSNVTIYNADGDRQEDVRVWTRARPHERDDRKGQCFAEMKCCQGKHWKKWTTTS